MFMTRQARATPTSGTRRFTPSRRSCHPSPLRTAGPLRRKLFLNVDDQPRLHKLSPQTIVLACQRDRSTGLGDHRIGLVSSLARIETGLALSCTTLAPRRQI